MWIQCDGKRPCGRCDHRGVDCRFVEKPWESKGSLRQEVERLREQRRRTERVLLALATTSDAERILQWVRNGNSVDDIHKRLEAHVDHKGRHESRGGCQPHTYGENGGGRRKSSTMAKGQDSAAAFVGLDQHAMPEADSPPSDDSNGTWAFQPGSSPSTMSSVCTPTADEWIGLVPDEEIGGSDTTAALHPVPQQPAMRSVPRSMEPGLYRIDGAAACWQPYGASGLFWNSSSSYSGDLDCVEQPWPYQWQAASNTIPGVAGNVPGFTARI